MESHRREIIIKFILEKECIDYMVFGVETEEQLKDIVGERDKEELPVDFVQKLEEKFIGISEKLILPIHWTV